MAPLIPRLKNLEGVGSGARPNGPKPDAQRAVSGDGVLWGAARLKNLDVVGLNGSADELHVPRLCDGPD